MKNVDSDTRGRAGCGRGREAAPAEAVGPLVGHEVVVAVELAHRDALGVEAVGVHRLEVLQPARNSDSETAPLLRLNVCAPSQAVRCSGAAARQPNPAVAPRAGHATGVPDAAAPFVPAYRHPCTHFRQANGNSRIPKSYRNEAIKLSWAANSSAAISPLPTRTRTTAAPSCGRRVSVLVRACLSVRACVRAWLWMCGSGHVYAAATARRTWSLWPVT